MSREVVVALIAAIGAGGLGAAFFQYLSKRRTAPAESQSIIVDAAQGAVIVQQGVIDSLKDQLERSRQELKAHAETFDEIEDRLAECEEARDGFRRELRRLEMDQLGREGKIERRDQ